MSLSAALYDAAYPDQLPVVAKGEPVDSGRFIVKLLDAKFGKAKDALPEKPERLRVEMEITNRSAGTSNAFMRLLTLANARPDLKAPRAPF